MNTHPNASHTALSAMDQEGPAEKKARLDNGDKDAYIPLPKEKENGDGTSTLSLIFSLQEQPGTLAKALRPFEVQLAS